MRRFLLLALAAALWAVPARASLLDNPPPGPDPKPAPLGSPVPVGTPARVPILMYHYVGQPPDPGSDGLGYRLTVATADFRAQMDWLQASGYHPIDFDDLYAYLAGQSGLPPRPVILTFDDGYADFYTDAYPILRAHDFKAVAYLVTGFLGGPNYLSRQQVLEVARHGVQVASHTVSHLDLTLLDPPALSRELRSSRAELESIVGRPVLDFCYPSGSYDANVLAAVAAAGYRDATTTGRPGVLELKDRFLWGRIRVSGGESFDDFARAVSQAAG